MPPYRRLAAERRREKKARERQLLCGNQPVRRVHRHAIEQASRRWRGGRRDDSAQTRRKILISTQAAGQKKKKRQAAEKAFGGEGPTKGGRRRAPRRGRPRGRRAVSRVRRGPTGQNDGLLRDPRDLLHATTCVKAARLAVLCLRQSSGKQCVWGVWRRGHAVATAIRPGARSSPFVERAVVFAAFWPLREELYDVVHQSVVVVDPRGREVRGRELRFFGGLGLHGRRLPTLNRFGISPAAGPDPRPARRQSIVRHARSSRCRSVIHRTGFVVSRTAPTPRPGRASLELARRGPGST